MQALKICDKDTKTSGCDVKLTNNYKYGNLTLKMVETIKMFCNHSEDKKTDFYVKIDDDLIMSPSKLDEIVRHMAATPCQFAGGFYIHLDFYYPSGQIYIFSRAVLDSVCKKLPTARLFSPWAEDLAFGGLVDSHDTNYTCSIKAPANHWHINYKDKRVKVHYYKQHND
ncbi:hypothetical protein GGI02_003095 [Coemansia sp. RSA 2322]|nr:hypothetical protein GGI02_003095 [Coemansia sp. RSA 2322]